MTRHQNTHTLEPPGHQPGAFFTPRADDKRTGAGARADSDFLRRWHDPYAPGPRPGDGDEEEWRIGDLDSGRGLALAVISVIVVVALLLGVTLAI